jgi:hypothetical protein
MAKIADATFKGKIGNYSFEVYPTDTSFNAVGAVYIFTKRKVGSDSKGTHILLYIGQTDSLNDRIPNHEKWPCANRNGVNCICIHREDSETSRLDKETDLRDENDTPCNDQ